MNRTPYKLARKGVFRLKWCEPEGAKERGLSRIALPRESQSRPARMWPIATGILRRIVVGALECVQRRSLAASGGRVQHRIPRIGRLSSAGLESSLPLARRDYHPLKCNRVALRNLTCLKKKIR